MFKTNVPIPINDPIRSYSKGTSERKQLKAQISELKNLYENQISELKDFYENQISKLKENYEGRIGLLQDKYDKEHNENHNNLKKCVALNEEKDKVLEKLKTLQKMSKSHVFNDLKKDIMKNKKDLQSEQSSLSSD